METFKTDIRVEFNRLDQVITEFKDHHELYEALDYSSRLHELIDYNIDIYYYELRKWAVDNWEYVEQAIEEGLTEGLTEYHKLIQCGQYCFYREQMYQEVEELYDELVEESEES